MSYIYGILNCGLSDHEDKWETSCKNLGQDYHKIDICSKNWQGEVAKSNADCFLLRPPGGLSYLKRLFDERSYIISKVMKRSTYPNLQEALVYENKRLLSYYLRTLSIPHPKTEVFYSEKEAYDFAGSASFPVVAKTNIGASGSGVNFLENEKELREYIKLAFSKGITRRRGPNRRTGNPKKWIKKALKSPAYALERIKEYRKRARDKQRNFVLFQEYVPHDYEWRIVAIGDSYFAHKKTKIGRMASGTKEKIYDNPPLELMDFAKNIMEKTGFYSQALDIFEHETRGYLVNEMQTIFGQSDDFQMKVDGKIGRYIYDDGWVFEEGDFNTNESYDLRLKHAVNLLDSGEL